MYHFCTYFDHNYIFRGLALHSSMMRHCGSFTLHILCLSDECYSILKGLGLPNVELITVKDLEIFQPKLTVAKSNRSKIEFYFTCTPIVLSYLLSKSDIDLITYLDSDTYFFASPEGLFDEIKGASVAFVSHRFPKRLKKLEIHGKYNVGWLTFGKDIDGLKCLNWYMERCLEWCYDIVEKNRYADQKYLDQFSSIANNVVEINHLGCNLAPWNVCNYKIGYSNGNVTVDGQRLILYHFEQLVKIRNGLYDSRLFKYKNRMSNLIKNKIYKIYICEIRHLTHKFNLKNSNAFSSIRNSRTYANFRLLFLRYWYNTLVKVNVNEK